MAGWKNSKYTKNTQNKYKNKKIETEDGVFDSQKEYVRWLILKDLQERGEISNLKRQERWLLIPPQELKTPVKGKNGSMRRSERKVEYVADFQYEDKLGHIVVEDVKGYKTPEYVMKRKLMLWVHRIQVVEV